MFVASQPDPLVRGSGPKASAPRTPRRSPVAFVPAAALVVIQR